MILESDLSRASSLIRLDEFCAKYDLDYREMLVQAKLPIDILTFPEDLIPYSRMSRLLENCALKSGCPLFALEYGMFQGGAVLGGLLYVIKNAATVGESLHELMRYHHLHTTGGRVSLEVEGGAAVLNFSPAILDETSSRYGTDRVVGLGRAFLGMLLGSKWQPRAAYFQSAQMALPQAYRRLLGVIPQFNSSYNALVFESRLLDLPLSESDPQLLQLMRKHFDQMESLSSKELPGYVTDRIRNLLPEGAVTTKKIADSMMLSPRSLQRYLAREGTSVQKLLEDTRKSIAEHYLLTSGLSLIQLAGLLGYADLATFSRAFQRWYGVSPRQWRQTKGVGK